MERKMHRDELITLGDLEIFKKDLLLELGRLLEGQTARSQSKKWLKSSEVKKLLGISTGTLQTLRLNGTLSHSKLGGTVYYNYDEIVKMLESNEQR